MRIEPCWLHSSSTGPSPVSCQTSPFFKDHISPMGRVTRLLSKPFCFDMFWPCSRAKLEILVPSTLGSISLQGFNFIKAIACSTALIAISQHIVLWRSLKPTACDVFCGNPTGCIQPVSPQWNVAKPLIKLEDALRQKRIQYQVTHWRLNTSV